MSDTRADYLRVLHDGIPLIDLRAPAEFALGAFPTAINLPLLTDAERVAIGTRYKACGQHAAIALGEELVSGGTRCARVDAWRNFIATHADTALYCFRGGLRSQIAQRWLLDAGVGVACIDGGYKALRRTCLQVIEEFRASSRLLLIGGRTGSGKTDLLQEFDAQIDLERLANHRGSAFGSTSTAQPTPIGFENRLAIEMLRKRDHAILLIEDESRTIGRLALPTPLHAAMQSAPLAVLEATRDERTRRIYHEYLEDPLTHGVAPRALHARFTDALDRIGRRLGGLRHAEVRRAIDIAFASGFSLDRADRPDLHGIWIGLLLDWYYDPMYDHQLAAKRSRVVASGNLATIRAFAHETLTRG